MIFPILRWFVSLPASMFYCLSALDLYEAVGSPPGLLGLAALLAQALLPSSVALWVLADARRLKHDVSYDFGSFVFFTWPLLAPIYLFSTRGWRAFAPLGCFVLLYAVASVTSVIFSCLVSFPVK
jgi:hypothetical protein